MLIDQELVLSDAQAITADAASTNYYDLGVARRAPGNATRITTTIVEAFNTLTSMNVIIECDDNSAFSSAKTLSTKNLLLADLAINKVYDLGEIPDGCERYIRARYDVVGTDPTLGKVTTVLHPLGSNQTVTGQE